MANSDVRSIKNELEEKRPDYEKMRDCMEGQSRIKSKDEQYLAMPPAIAELSEGSSDQKRRYDFYKSFAEFPELVQPAVDGIQGLIHGKAPTVELSPVIEYMLESATNDGKTLQSLWQDVTREVLITGRTGLLPDFELTSEQGQSEANSKDLASSQVQPENVVSDVYLCQYTAERLINWRRTKTNSAVESSFMVLEEDVDSQNSIDEFSNQEDKLYRVLRFRNGQYTQQTHLFETGSSGAETIGDEILPSRLGRTFSQIPFVTINAINLELDIGPIPLLGVANKSLDIYRKSASYGRSLYLVGDPTVIRTGVSRDESEKYDQIGGGQAWDFEQPDANVQLLELKGQSIPAVRTAIQDDKEEASSNIAKLMDDNSGGVESAEALRIRQASRQVTAKSLVLVAAQGIEKALKICTEVMGGNPDDTTFSPNLDFSEIRITGAELLQIIQSKTSGAPISMRTIHEIARRGGLTNLTLEEELDLIRTEQPSGMPSGLTGRSDNLDDDDDE